MASGSKRKLTFLSESTSEVTNLTWKIDNFLEKFEVTQPLQLKKTQLTFDAGESFQLPTKWRIFLSTTSVGKPGKVGLQLELLDSPKDLKEIYASWNVVIEDAEGSVYKRLDTNPTNMKKGCLGWDHVFIDRGYLSSHKIVSNGTLVLNIEFKLFKFEKANGYVITPEEDTRQKIARFQEASKNLILDDFERLFNEGSNSDFKIVMKDGKEFLVHKTVLSARSPVFSAMFKSKMKEASRGVVQVADLSSKTMEIVLKFIYTGRVDENWKKAEVVEELVYAAEKYSLEQLKEFCDTMLCDAVTAENAMNILKLARKFKLKKAETEIKKYISQMLNKVLSVTMLAL